MQKKCVLLNSIIVLLCKNHVYDENMKNYYEEIKLK